MSSLLDLRVEKGEKYTHEVADFETGASHFFNVPNERVSEFYAWVHAIFDDYTVFIE